MIYHLTSLFSGKHDRRSLDPNFTSSSQTPKSHSSGRFAKTPPQSSLGDFLVVKTDKQAGKKNKKKKAKSLSPAVEPTVSRVIPGLNLPAKGNSNQDVPKKELERVAAKLDYDDDETNGKKTADAKEVADGGSFWSPGQVGQVTDQEPSRQIEKHDAWVKIAKSIDTNIDSREEVAAVLLSTPCKKTAPKPKLLPDADTASMVTADPSLVTIRETLDKLALLYAHMLKANLVVNLSAELYFLVELLTAQDTAEKSEIRLKMTPSG